MSGRIYCECGNGRACSYHQALMLRNYFEPVIAWHETVGFTCIKCGKELFKRLPHKTRNKDIVEKWRGYRWTMEDNGKKATCPKCGKKGNTK